MANTKSAIKAARQTERLTLRNRSTKTRIKTLQKKLLKAKAGEDNAATKVAAAALISAMDKATKSGVIHKNAASRAKSKVSEILFAK